MSPRRRTIHDSDIAHAAASLLCEAGASAVTFAKVSQRCGLAPPTLVQRFGTRERMLEETIRVLTGGLASRFAASADLTTALRDTAAELGAILGGASQTAGAAQYSLELRKQISYSLALLIERNELPRCDVAQLARALQFAFVGAIAVAALEQGRGDEAITEAVAGVLSSYT